MTSKCMADGQGKLGGMYKEESSFNSNDEKDRVVLLTAACDRRHWASGGHRELISDHVVWRARATFWRRVASRAARQMRDIV
eukprot:CAMPEP_0115157538 /NCGR_PEP_ID=MMETSP0227-20121206/69094_1 /TAXON_ID=89957 /ORGANISM="Polarella glacialis, Strain CCMP 1383" /LENGTH=81 /DNA_ID=CAMNT_0002568913 /DNA_START=180 /DNA_END=424 /DNA_ORIENTATION=+